MKVAKTAIVGLLAFSVLGSTFAAPSPDDDSRPDAPYHEHRRDQGGPDRGPGQDQPRRYQQEHRAYRNDMPRPNENWNRGDRVPQKYRGKGYYVNDWRSRELPPPPPGHRWLRINGDYVLVAIVSGVITQILLGGH